MLTNTERKGFRYTKKEQLLGIGWLIVSLFFIGFGVYIPRLVHKWRLSDIYGVVSYFLICFIGVVYSIHLWLRRRSFAITVNKEGIIISRLGRFENINWKMIDSYTYQCGYHFWFLSLFLFNRRRITIHGKLQRFNDLVKIIKENIPVTIKEFQYTMRKRLVIFLFSILLFFNIVLGIPLLKYGVAKYIPWSDALGCISLLLILSLIAIFQNFRWGLVNFLVSDEGLTMKPWLGRQVFISWSEISSDAQIELKDVPLTIVARAWNLTIKSKDRSISFYEDLDNVDELIDVIENKSGLELNL